jgi:heptosyltransferase-1
VLVGSTLVVGVDTGLTHLAAATNRPTVGLFLDYPIELVGLTGKNVRSLGGVDANPSVDEVLAAIKEVQS